MGATDKDGFDLVGLEEGLVAGGVFVAEEEVGEDLVDGGVEGGAGGFVLEDAFDLGLVAGQADLVVAEEGGVGRGAAVETGLGLGGGGGGGSGGGILHENFYNVGEDYNKLSNK